MDAIFVMFHTPLQENQWLGGLDCAFIQDVLVPWHRHRSILHSCKCKLTKNHATGTGRPHRQKQTHKQTNMLMFTHSQRHQLLHTHTHRHTGALLRGGWCEPSMPLTDCPLCLWLWLLCDVCVMCGVCVVHLVAGMWVWWWGWPASGGEWSCMQVWGRVGGGERGKSGGWGVLF